MESNKLFEEVRQAMANGAPLARYKKTIVGNLNARILDQITGTPTDVILTGDANKGDETAILTFWTPVEVAYFERANKYHLGQGMLVPYVKEDVKVDNPNAVTDEELTKVLSSKFLVIRNMLGRFTSPVPAERMLALAEQMDKPVGTINAIRTRLVELQADEFEKV